MLDLYFADLENHPRIVVGLDEDDIQMILKQYNSNLVLFELSPTIYSIKDIAGTVYTMVDHDGTLIIEYDDICMKNTFFDSFWRKFWNAKI